MTCDRLTVTVITPHRALSLAAAALGDCLKIVETLPGEDRSLEQELRAARDFIIHLRDYPYAQAPTSQAQTTIPHQPTQTHP